MRTSDFTTKPSSKVMNETLNKKFGEKLDIENYSDEQLKKAAGLIESRIAVLKKGKFNETLESEEFHRLKLMQDIVKTAITERAKNPYAIGMAAAKKQAGITAKHAHDLPKAVVKKGHEIAKKVKEGSKKDQDGDGDNDFADVMIARMKKGGKSHGQAVAATKGKSYNKESVNEISDKKKQNAIDSAMEKNKEHKSKGWNKKGEEKKGTKAAGSREKFVKKTDQAARVLKTMKESYEYLLEGEESKAELIMAVKDMVDKFTGWSEDIAQMQANTAMEMADAIRDELGADQAEAFTASVQPALDAAFQSVKSAREALNNSVASLTGVAPTPMGAEPGMDAGMDMDTGMEPGADLAGDMDMGDEVPGDDAEMDVATPVDRAKRESIEHRLRLTKLLVGR